MPRSFNIWHYKFIVFIQYPPITPVEGPHFIQLLVNCHFRADMVGNKAAVGRGSEGVRWRHVERHRLHNQRPLRCHSGPQNSVFLSGL